MNPGAEGHDRGFAALLSIAAAIERRQAWDLTLALRSVPQVALLRTAARHRCLGYIRRHLLELGVRDEPARALIDALREYAAKAAMQAYATRSQLAAIMEVLTRAGVPFALLKGAARLARGDKEADCNTMYDLDMLVAKEHAHAALEALEHAGYRPDGIFTADRYLAKHHHLIPLAAPGPGLSVELHTQLAPRGMLSMPTDWAACSPHLEQIEGGAALALDPLWTAAHLAIHGAGLRRLHDVIMLARMLRADPGLQDRLLELLTQERWQPVALQAVVALAARVAGIPADVSPDVDRYLAWVIRREDLAPYVRDRSQFVDAWYANRGSLFGAATRLALPEGDPGDAALVATVRFAYRLCGRIITSAIAAATPARA